MNPEQLQPAVSGAPQAALQLTVALVVVLGLILLLQRIARRYGAGFAAGGQERIEIVTQRAIGPRVSLAVVRVMGRTLLVGISPQGVQAVSELEDLPNSRPIDSGRTSPPVQPPHTTLAPRPNFWQAFRLNLKRTLIPGATPIGTPNSPAPALQRPELSRAPREQGLPAARPVSPVSAERAAGPSAIQPEPFEEELASRLRELRDRYPTLWEVESTGIGGVH